MKNIRTAIRRLDHKTLAQLLPESLTEEEIEDLLLLADEAAAKEIAKAAARIAKAKPKNIARLTVAHCLCMQNYIFVRAVLRGEKEEWDDAIGDLGIF